MRPTNNEDGSSRQTEEQPDENSRMGGIAIAITAETGSGVAMPSDEVITAVVKTATVEEKPDELEMLAESQDGLKREAAVMAMAVGHRQHQGQEHRLFHLCGLGRSDGFRFPFTTASIPISRSVSATSLWESFVIVMRCTLVLRSS